VYGECDIQQYGDEMIISDMSLIGVSQHSDSPGHTGVRWT